MQYEETNQTKQGSLRLAEHNDGMRNKNKKNTHTFQYWLHHKRGSGTGIRFNL